MADDHSKILNQQMIRITDDYYIYKDQQLGSGGFGCVYKGFCKSINKQIAIKMPKKYIRKQNKQQFEKQIKIFSELSKLIHPHLLQFYGFQKTQKSAYLFMQLCPNNLHKEIHQKQGLNQLQVLTYFQQIVKGMSYINIRNIIHRDLKPQNILIDINNKIKLTDFGLSRTNMNDISKTTGLGTLIYMAPQISNHKKYNQNCDVWSLGAILYEMLTKKRLFLFENRDLIKQQYQKFNTSQKRVKYNQNYHPFWQYFTNLMLTYNHQKRIKNTQLLRQINIAYSIMQFDILNNTHNAHNNEKIIKIERFINYQKQKLEIYQKIVDSYKSKDFCIQSPVSRVIRLLCLCILLKKMKNLIRQFTNRQISISEKQQLQIKDEIRERQLEFYMKKYQLDLEITYQYYFGKVSMDINENIKPVIDQIDPSILTDFQKKTFNDDKFYRKKLTEVINQLNYITQMLSYGSFQFLSFYLRIIVVSKEQTIFFNQSYQEINYVKKYIQSCLKGSKQQIIERIKGLLNSEQS